MTELSKDFIKTIKVKNLKLKEIINMKIDDLILELQDILGSAKSVPFSGGKVMVDSDQMYNIIEQIQDAMPSEISQAKNVVADRKAILTEAKKEAENIIRNAEERKKTILNQNELVREAKVKAKEIVDDAKAKAKEIRTATNVYSDSILKTTEETLTSQLEVVKRTRAKFSEQQKPQK
jgi:F0F1-type ATP synthase membrane subunit b/b'